MLAPFLSFFRELLQKLYRLYCMMHKPIHTLLSKQEYAMQKKFGILSLFLILAVILSACGTALAQAPSAEPVRRTLSVNGSAQVSLPPDIAYISIGVHTESEDAKQAVAENNSLVEKVVAALKAMGIEDKDLLTTRFNIYPSQQYTPEGQLKGTIFMVDNLVYVTLRDLNKIGDVLNAAIDAGANNISGIQFDVADKNKALAEARKSAVANARALAEELAQAAGVSLGQIQSLNFYGGGIPPTPFFEAKGGGMGVAGSNVPISTGQITLSVEVNIVYEIQ
jgi:hypothetical protein